MFQLEYTYTYIFPYIHAVSTVSMYIHNIQREYIKQQLIIVFKNDGNVYIKTKTNYKSVYLSSFGVMRFSKLNKQYNAMLSRYARGKFHLFGDVWWLPGWLIVCLMCVCWWEVDVAGTRAHTLNLFKFKIYNVPIP